MLLSVAGAEKVIQWDQWQRGSVTSDLLAHFFPLQRIDKSGGDGGAFTQNYVSLMFLNESRYKV